VTIVDSKTRMGQLKMAMSELLCYPLWHAPWRRRHLWERIAALPFIVPMGLVNLFGAATSIYFGEAISWLGYHHVNFQCWLEEGLGFKASSRDANGQR